MNTGNVASAGREPANAGHSGGVATVSTVYAPPVPDAPIDLFLDANEGFGAWVDVPAIAAKLAPDAARRYPSAKGLERVIAGRLGIGDERVLVTAGGDEAIDRACRSFLGPGRELVLPTPTFEMIARYARLAGAGIRTTPWPDGPYPIDDVLRLVGERTAMIAVVSPNNPTGAVASVDDLRRLAAAAPRAVLLVDLAYTEFADTDLTPAAIALPNSVIIRTFSKAFGLAGLRVGFAAGPEPLLRSMRAAGSPYPVSRLSLAAAEDSLRNAEVHLPGVVNRVRAERSRLCELLRELGAEPRNSRANFVLASMADADWVWRALASIGIGVRRFHQGDGLDASLRITCPGEESSFARLCAGLRAAARPEAILLGLDGVLAAGRVNAPRDEAAGPLIPDRALLERLARRVRLGVVTGRPRAYCEQFLERFDLSGLFGAVVCMEDAPPAPDPSRIRLAAGRLGASACWMVGSAPDGMVSARAAGVIPLGIAPAGDGKLTETDISLRAAGAARVLHSLTELEELLPCSPEPQR